MSDTRRRRKQSGGSDDLSDSYDELNATKETQSSEQTDARHDSEYDTAGSDAESEAGSQDGGERESGDGQEEDKPQRKLDDDEDRRNPQYIPKRGTFYEHDDRTSEEQGESTAEPPPERETKEKKVWKDKEDRWNHDRYNDDEQAPKSHEELIAVYGYDIRNEEGPPRARRRRRYGRGPNKYTRNWEDEDAYGKTAASVTGGKNTGRKSNRSGEEFPALGGSNKDVSTESVDEPVISSAWYSNKNKTQTKQQNFPPLQSQQENNKAKIGSADSTIHTNENKAPNEPTNPAWKRESKNWNQNSSPNRNASGSNTEKVMTPKLLPREAKDPKKRQVQESVSLAASRARGRGMKVNSNNNMGSNRTTDMKPKGRGAGLISSEPRRNNVVQQQENEPQAQHLVNEMKQASLNDGSYNSGGRQNKNFYAQSPGQQRPNPVPPRMQQQLQQQQQQQQQQQPPQQLIPQQQPDVSGNRPKRYSSLRQRPAIPEGQGQAQQPYPPQHPQRGYYPPQAGNSHGVLESQGFPQAHFEPPAPVGNSAAPMTGQPVIPLAPGGQPAGYAPPPFLVPPPQFIPPQAAPPNIINYVPTPAGPAFPPNFQSYQGYNPTVQAQGPPPPPELFQPQGCTYYSPAQQQQQQGAPLRRPKAAIPILPPPDSGNQYHQGSRGRGRTGQHGHASMPGNNMPLTSATLQHQELDGVAASTVEPETKAEVEIFENAEYEIQQQQQQQQQPQEQQPQEQEQPNFLPEQFESVKPEIVASSPVEHLPTAEPELQQVPLPKAIDIQSLSESSADIPKDAITETSQIVASTNDLPEPAEPLIVENKEDTSCTTPKTVDLDIINDDPKITKVENNVVLEKPVVEETAA